MILACRVESDVRELLGKPRSRSKPRARELITSARPEFTLEKVAETFSALLQAALVVAFPTIVSTNTPRPPATHPRLVLDACSRYAIVNGSATTSVACRCASAGKNFSPTGTRCCCRSCVCCDPTRSFRADGNRTALIWRSAASLLESHHLDGARRSMLSPRDGDPGRPLEEWAPDWNPDRRAIIPRISDYA